jgi:hypothetical protein
MCMYVTVPRRTRTVTNTVYKTARGEAEDTAYRIPLQYEWSWTGFVVEAAAWMELRRRRIRAHHHFRKDGVCMVRRGVIAKKEGSSSRRGTK